MTAKGLAEGAWDAKNLSHYPYRKQCLLNGDVLRRHTARLHVLRVRKNPFLELSPSGEKHHHFNLDFDLRLIECLDANRRDAGHRVSELFTERGEGLPERFAGRIHDVEAHHDNVLPRRLQFLTYIAMALDPEVQRVVLLDGPAFLGDPSRWPSQNACLEMTKLAVAKLIAEGTLKPIDVEAAARLLRGAALNVALWVAASEHPESVLPKAVEAFRLLATGLVAAKNGN